MAVFLLNICKFNGCGKEFQSLRDLIHHIEDTHIGNYTIQSSNHSRTSKNLANLFKIWRVFLGVYKIIAHFMVNRD